jgi:starch synthase
MKIVFATAEVSPIAKTGGLGDVCGSLPKALARLGHEVVIFMPFYRQARQWFEKNGAPLHQTMPTVPITWANWSAEATFLRSTLPGTSIPLILVANDHFFDRDQLYQGSSDGIDDSLLRYAFFNRAIVRGCELLDLSPDILHCHDWHTALLPLYLHSGLRGGSPQFANTRSIYTIHNLHYQGASDAKTFDVLGLHSRYWAPDALEHFGTLNPMKGAILFADEVTTVSPHYGREIMTAEHGAGLDGVLRAVRSKFTGILNGIDVEEWNPATDPLLPARYSESSLGEKRRNKQALAQELRLPFSDERPIIGAVSRLVGQKGFQLLLPVLERLLGEGAQVVLLGSGETELENAFSLMSMRYPEHCRAWIGFDNALAHRIYAGADMLLMPSIYEPCGLNQMYALRYGTIPVVRMTGGLVDTVTPFDGRNVGEATGFGFFDATPEALYGATAAAIRGYREPSVWKRLQANGMAHDFSWDRSAKTYDALYRRATA